MRFSDCRFFKNLKFLQEITLTFVFTGMWMAPYDDGCLLAIFYRVLHRNRTINATFNTRGLKGIKHSRRRYLLTPDLPKKFWIYPVLTNWATNFTLMHHCALLACIQISCAVASALDVSMSDMWVLSSAVIGLQSNFTIK